MLLIVLVLDVDYEQERSTTNSKNRNRRTVVARTPAFYAPRCLPRFRHHKNYGHSSSRGQLALLYVLSLMKGCGSSTRRRSNNKRRNIISSRRRSGSTISKKQVSVSI